MQSQVKAIFNKHKLKASNWLTCVGCIQNVCRVRVSQSGKSAIIKHTATADIKNDVI